VNPTQEEQQRQQLQKELEQLEKQIQALKERQKDGFQDIDAQKQLKEDLLKVTEKLDVKTEKNGAVFYDNEHRWAYDTENNKLQQINVNYERAVDFCKQPENSHCKTITDTEGGKWLDSQKIHECFTNGDDAKEVWRNLSKNYAQNAEGETHSFVKIDSAKEAIWEFTEKPTLQNNEKVTAINYHYHPTPDQEVIRRENLARPEPERIYESKELSVDRISETELKVSLQNGKNFSCPINNQEEEKQLLENLKNTEFREELAKYLDQVEKGKSLTATVEKSSKSSHTDYSTLDLSELNKKKEETIQQPPPMPPPKQTQ
jgi:hypothetical protein